MGVLNYTVFFEPLEEGGYMVIVPALPGIVTYGETLDEARAMAADAIKCHCEGLLKDGEQLPKDKGIEQEPVKEKVAVKL
jgi:antitoxin HicB